MERKYACKPANFKLVEAAHNTWHDDAEPGVVYDDILKPEYWAHIARGVKVGDHIQVKAMDGTFFAWLMIEAVTGTGVFVSELLFRKEVGVVEQAVEGDFYVQWVRGDDRWRIVRASDKEVVDRGYPNKTTAEEAMNAMIKKVSNSAKAETA